MSANCLVCLEMLDNPVLLPTTSTVVDWVRTSEYLDSANYDGALYYFEVKGGGVSGIVHTLRDITNGTDVATITTDSAPGKRYRSTAFTPAAGNCLYQLRTPAIATGSVSVSAARIIIVQVDATKTRVSIPLCHLDYYDASNAKYIDRNKSNSYAQTLPLNYNLWTYTAANWDALDSFSFEAMLFSSSATKTVYAALTKADGTVVGEVSTDSATQVYLTAAIASLTDGTAYQLMLKGDATATYYAQVSKARLYVKLTSLVKAETYFKLGGGLSRTSDATMANLVKAETGSYSTPVVYADWTGWLAATDDWATGHLYLLDRGTGDIDSGGSGRIASSAWNMNTTTAKAAYRAGPVTVTADDRLDGQIDWNAQTVNVCGPQLIVVSFTGTAPPAGYPKMTGRFPVLSRVCRGMG